MCFLCARSDSKREFDFLSSIEMCIIDQADTMCMQNWEHVLTVLQCLNRTPEQSHDTDFSRVRDLFLNGQYVPRRNMCVVSTCVLTERKQTNMYFDLIRLQVQVLSPDNRLESVHDGRDQCAIQQSVLELRIEAW